MKDELILEEIKSIYEDYFGDVIHLEATRKPMEGLMGFGKRPDQDACHDRFSTRLEQAINTFAAQTPSSEEVSEVLRLMFDAPNAHKDLRLAFWMLQAVQGLTDKLIVFLSPEAAADLTASYTEAYPKRVRLPVQQTIALHLQAQAGGSAEKKGKGLTHFFRGAGR